MDATTPIAIFEAPENVSGKAILNLRAGQVLTLRNVSAAPLTLAAAPQIGAQLDLIRISDIETGEKCE